MTQTSARAAVDSDLDALVRLDSLLRDSFAELRGGEIYLLRNHREEPVEESFRSDMRDSNKSVVVGVIGDFVAGFGVVGLSELTESYTLAEISELFVDPALREVGVGAAIMAELTAWARNLGAHGLDSQAMPGDRDTKNFFESHGLVARALQVHADLD